MNESTPKFDYEESPSPRKTGAIIAGIVFALLVAGNIYLLARINRLQTTTQTLQGLVDSKIAKVQESTSSFSGQTRQELEALRNDIQAAMEETQKTAQKHARTETAWLARNVTKQQREQQEQLLGEIQTVNGKTVQTEYRVDEISGDLDSVKVEVGETQSQLAQTHSELNQTVEHMGDMNEQLASQQSNIAALRTWTERNRVMFELSKSGDMQKVGDVQLRLRNTNAKHNRYTLEVMADDTMVVKKERTVNEPVQFYVAGSPQPYEIVITQVTKDRVTGYLATPKARTVRG